MEDINLTKCKWNGTWQQKEDNSCTVRCHKRILCQNPPKRYYVKSTTSPKAHTGKSSLPLEPSLSQGHLLPMKAVALCVLTPSQTSYIKQETQIVHNRTWQALNFYIVLLLNELHLKTHRTIGLHSGHPKLYTTYLFICAEVGSTEPHQTCWDKTSSNI